MKPSVKNLFKAKLLFVIVLMVCFCFAGLSGVGSNNVPVGDAGMAFAETTSLEETSDTESGETGLNEEEVDVSTYGLWEEDVEEPGIFEGVGSVNTSTKKVVVTSNKHLAWVAKQVNDNSSTYSLFSGWTIELQADISLGGKIWTPIGNSSSYKFKGTFIGNGHIISGLTFESSSSRGLFYYCTGATIKDVIIQDCINVSNYALAGYSGAKLFNCVSKGDTLANSSNTIYHCISNGTNSNSKGTVYGSKPIGADQSYYITEIYDKTGGLSDDAITTGALESTISTSQTSLSINLDKNGNGYFKYFAIDKIEFYSYEYNGSSADWTKQTTLDLTDDSRVYSYTTFGFSISQGASVATRSWPSASGITSIGTGTYSLSFAYQNAVKIKIYIDWRYVNVQHSLFAINGVSTSNNYASLNTLYNSTNGYAAAWAAVTQQTSYYSGKLSDGTDVPVSASYEKIEYGETITFTESYASVIKLGARVNYGESEGDYDCNWSNTGKLSIDIDKDSIYEYSSQLYCDISVRLMNLFRIKLNNATASLTSDKVVVGTGASAILYAYNINTVSDMTSAKFVHEVDYTTGMKDTISNVYISDSSSVGTKSLGGNTYVYESSSNIPGTKYASTASSFTNWSLTNDKDMYCGWVLATKTLTISKTDNSYLILEGKQYNPYTAKITTIKTSIGSESFPIYATYIVRIYNTTTNTNALTANILMITTTNDYDNVVRAYEETKFKEGNATTTGSSTNNYSSKTQGASITMYDGATYTITLKAKEVRLLVDFMVYTPSTQMISKTFDVIDNTYRLKVTNGTEGETLSRNTSASDSANVFNPEFNTSTKHYYLTHDTITLDKIDISWDYISTNVATYKLYQFYAYDYSGSSSTFLRLRSYTNESVEFDFAPAMVDEGSTIKLVIIVEPYSARFPDGNLIYDVDYSANKTFYHFANPAITYPSTYTIKVTAQVKFMKFQELKLNGGVIYSTLGGTYKFGGQTITTSGSISTGVTLSLYGDASIVIKAVDKKSGSYVTGQEVEISFNKLPYTGSDYSLALGYDKIEYAMYTFAFHNDTDGTDYKSEYVTNNITYLDTIKTSRNTTNINNIDLVHTYHNGSKFVSSTKTFNCLEYFAPTASSIMETTGLAKLNASVISSASSPSIAIDFDPSGIDVNVIAVDSTNATNNYIATSGTFAISDYIDETISAKAINYYTYDYMFITEDSNSTQYQTIKPDVISYGNLLQYVSNGILNINAIYSPISYTLKFMKGSTLVDSSSAIYTNTTTINDYLKNAGKLDDFLKDGYDLIFASGNHTFKLDATIQEVIEACGNKTEASTIILTACYSAKVVQYRFILKGESTPIKIYTSTFATPVDWESLVKEIASDLLTERKVLVISWDEKESSANIAKYDSYSLANSEFVYSYTDWLPSTFSPKVDIIGTYNNVAINAKFNGYYLANETEVTTTVSFGTNEYGTVPTPTRKGYSFAYWKAIDSKGNVYFIYSGSVTGTNTIVTTGDSTLNFYAYWSVIERTFILGNNSFVYDATSHTIVVATINELIPDMNNKVHLYKADGTLVSSKNLTNTNITHSVKYVADSASFYVVYEYNYVASNASAPNSAFYLLPAPASTKSGTAKITVTPKQLTVDGTITKEFDNTRTVLQDIVGVFAADKNLYKIKASYASVNVKKDILISYSVTCSNAKIAGSYSSPVVKQGTITPRIIHTNISGTTIYPGIDAEKIMVAQGTFDDAGATFTTTNGTVVFSNESEVATLLGTSRTLSFKITTINSKEQVFAPEYFEIELLEKGSACTDFKIVIDSSTYEIVGLEEDQRGFTFFAIVHPDHPNYATATIGTYVYSVSMDNAKTISNYSFNIVKKPVATGDTLTFDVNVDFKDANWWLLNARVVDKKTGTATIVPVNLFSDGVASFDYIVGANKNYDVYLQFTNVSNVSYELGLIDAEKATTAPSNTTVQYGSKFTLPTPARSGLSFSKWFYIDNAGEQVIVTTSSISWTIKGDVTLYALWTYNATITLSGSSVSAEYEPDVTYKLEAKNNSTNNTYLDYNHIWSRATSQNGTYVPVNSEDEPMLLSLRNVADSGYYRFTFGIGNIPSYLDEYISISLNVKIVNDIIYVIRITPKELALYGSINKQYDGEAILNYTIKSSDVDARYNEIVNQEVVVTYTSSNVGAKISAITAGVDSVIAKNYILSANGSIIKREVTINIGTQKYTYNGSIATYVYGEETLDTIKFSNIAVKTTGSSVGVYTQSANKLTISFEAILIKNNVSVSTSYFNFTINGSIEIQAKTFEDSDVKIVWEKTYNTAIQNVSVYVLGTLITDYYVVTKGGSTFEGGINAGTYSDVSVVITYPNYAEYRKTANFIINPQAVFVNVTASNISKAYDGTVSISSLVNGTDYKLYADSSKTTEISSVHLNNIVKNSLLSFVFNSASAGEDKQVQVRSNSTNYTFSLINENLKGDITKKNITLTVSSVSKFYDGKAFEVDSKNITPNTLITGDVLSGKLTINVTEAGVYGLTSLSVSNFDLAALRIGSDGLLTNYNVTSVNGSVEIKKANITVALTQTDYVYTGTTQDILYIATRNNDDQDVTDIIQIVEGSNTGINVGSYTVSLEIKDEHANNYNFTSNTYAYEIIVKNVTLKIRAGKVYDGSVFTYYLNKNNDLLCSGHSFGDSFARTKGVYFGDYEYSEDGIDINIKVTDALGTDVATNYNFVYDIILTIGKENLTADDIVKTDYTYNSEIQKIEFTVVGDKISFVGQLSSYKTTGYDGYRYYNQGKEIVVSFARITENATAIDCDFKYVSTYRVTLTSNMYNDYSFEIKITPKVITTFTAQTTKEYDGTTDVVGEVSSDDIFANDKKYVSLVGTYGAVFGATNITVELKFNNPTGQYELDNLDFNLLQQSYMLADNLSLAAKIVAREVIFVYTYAQPYYYNGNKLTLGVEKFTLSNMIDSENFGGSVDFANVINAGEYNLATQDVDISGLTITAGSSFEYYSISFVGTFVVSKAQVVVSKVTNDTHTYSAEAKSVTLTAYIYNNRGAILSGIDDDLLVAKYKQSVAGEFISPINVGSYYIYPEVNTAYVSNYQYVGSENLSNESLTPNTLTIVAREVVVVANKEIVYDMADNSFELLELDTIVTNIVAGHKYAGVITIDSSVYAIATFIYKTGEISEGVTLSNFVITEGGNSVLSNYLVTYDITIVIVETVGLGQSRALAKQNYEYNAQNQINDIAILVEIGTDAGVKTVEVELDTVASSEAGQYAKVLGFYTSLQDAQSGAQAALTTVKDVNVYYVKVVVDVKGTGTFASEYKYAPVKIIEKTISKASLSYNNVAFLGIREYNASSKIVLASTDVYEADKALVTITATYYSSSTNEEVDNVGSGYIVRLTLSGDGASNYVLATTKMDGCSITKRTVTITDYVDTDVYYYRGVEQITLPASKFIIEGQVSGHSLAGEVVLSILNAGAYPIVEGTNTFVIMSSSTDVSNNYKIEINGDVIFVMNRAQVTISWDKGELVYNAQDRMAEIKAGLTLEGDYTTGALSDLTIAFNDNVVVAMDADSYQITVATSTSGNYAFTISTTNNTIVITQKDISIDLGMLEVKYKEYKAAGYNLSYDMVTGGYPSDKDSFELGTYKVSVAHEANTTYYAQQGTDSASGNTFIKYNSITLVLNGLIDNNYNVTEIVGGIKIIPENINFEAIAPFVYNGQDRFDELVIVYSGEDGTTKSITSADTTNGTITRQVIRNAGEYIVEVVIDTAIYNRTVTVNALTISAIDVELNKLYDGTTTAYGPSGNDELTSADIVDGDDIVITAEYDGYKYSETAYTITFAKSGSDAKNYVLPGNYSGKILRRPITLDFGTKTLVYNINNIYQVELDEATSIVGGTITDSIVLFALKNNMVGSGLKLTTANAAFDISGLVIKNGADTVTDCYEISVDITVNITEKEFSITFNGYDNNQVIYDASDKKVTVNYLGLTEQEMNIIALDMVIKYSYTDSGDVLATGTYPVNVGKYTATASYEGLINYALTGVVKYEYEIIPYTYVADTNAIETFVKEYATEDPVLTQSFTQQFASGAHTFTIVYDREPGENLGKYDLILEGNYCDSLNIKFVYQENALADKFEIVQNTSSIVLVTINTYKAGDFARYYGFKDIGLFTIDEFNYTCTISGNVVEGGITSGTVLYNAGSVGLYDVNSSELVSTNFTRFEIASDIQLEIKARTLLISATNYDKVYDGTIDFVNELIYNYNSVSAEGTLSSEDIEALGEVAIAIAYASADVGTHALTSTLSTHIGNFNISFAQATGKITQLEIEVTVETQTIIYGEQINVGFTVDYPEDADNKPFTAEELKSFVTIVVDGIDSNLSTAGYANVGEYTISINTNANVINTKAINARVIINVKEVIITATPKIYKIQDGTTEIDLSQYVLSMDGVFDNDVVEVISASFASASSGTNKTVNFVLDGIDSKNYLAKTTLGDIGQRLITFNFVYYGYTGCPVTSSQVNSATTTVKSIAYDYYNSITATNPNSLPKPAFIGKGYEMIGWSTTTDSSGIINPAQKICDYVSPYSESISLYAIWEIQDFDITLYQAKYNFKTNLYDISLLSTVKLPYMHPVDISAYATNIAHYTYLGYGIGNTNRLYTTPYQVEDNATIYLVYDLNKQVVVFDANGGVFSNQNYMFEYISAGRASIQVYYGQQIGEVIDQATLNKYTVATKTGYTFTSWTVNGQNKSLAQLASYVVSDDTIITASWTANQYVLTLYGVDGKFSLTPEQVSLGWTYVSNSNEKAVQISVAYSSTIPTLLAPSKDYYTFVGYVDSQNNVWDSSVQTTWTELGPIALYATYVDMDYMLKVTTVNSAISIVVKDSEGVVVNVEDISSEKDVYIFNVKTSYSATITAQANEGYNFKEFTSDVAYGTAVGNVYKIESFTGNPEIAVVVEARDNVIKLKVNDDRFGYISAEIGDQTYASNGNSTFTIKTGEGFVINATANEGYLIGTWSADGSGTLTEFSSTSKVLSDFVADVVVYVEFVEKDLNITIINDAVKGSYIYNATTYTESQTVVVKTGTDIVLNVSANYGYDVVDSAFEFVTDSENKGSIVVAKDGERYLVTLSGFTADGTITINYKTREFTLTFGYAEYDEQTGEINPVANVSDIITISEINYKVDDSVSFEFLTEISISSAYEKTGYIFYSYTYLVDSEFVTMVGVNGQNTLTFNIDNDYNLYLVYQRETYTVTYKVSDSRHGSVQFAQGTEDGIQIVETVRYGRNTSSVIANVLDYRLFNGWMLGETLVSTETTLPQSEVLNDTTYVAEIDGSSQIFNIVIRANGTYAVADEIDSILSAVNGVAGTASQSTDENGNIVITIPVLYVVGDEISVEIAVNDYYQAIKNSLVGDDYSFELGVVTPDIYDTEDNPYVIDLSLRYYIIEIKSNAERAVIFDSIPGKCVGLGMDSNFNPNGEVMAIAYVQYGGTLVVEMRVQSGYNYVGQDAVTPFVISDTEATLANITEDATITFNFEKTKYRVTFNTNYPEECLGEVIENVTNKEFVFYIEQDGTTFKNADGSKADLTNLIASQVFKTDATNAVFKFDGWSVSDSLGSINRTYLFDQGGIYYIDENETKVYGFNFYKSVDLDEDGQPDTDASGNVITYLYGAWTLPTYKVSVEYAPDSIIFEGDLGYHFQSIMGIVPVYQDGTTICEYLEVAQGVQVAMFTAPELDGYRYYGWKLATDSAVTAGYVDLIMPANELTIVLYYQFKVQVLVEESIAKANTALVNTQSEVWVIVGEELSFVATAGQGFAFKQWKLDGAVVAELGSSFKTNATDTATYTAVFEGNLVEVVLRNTTHTDLAISIQSKVPEQAVKDMARVGDTVRVTIEAVDYGYSLQAIAVNASTNDVAKDTTGNYYEYVIKQVDGVAGKIYVDAIVNALSVSVNFSITMSNAGSVTVNDVIMTDATGTYSYNDNLNVVTKVNARYNLIGITVNGVAIDCATSFIKAINQENGFVTDKVNTVVFEFEKLYWIDIRESLVGYGTKEAPYLIPNAQSLAYMAYLINNNRIDQSLNRIYYKVTADIDLAERFWIPIGTEQNPFDGTFILGKYKITGASFAEKYDHFSWEEYCPGVFGYVTENAEIVIDQSMLPTIIMIAVISAIAIVIIIIIVIIIKRREKKMRRLSGNLGVSSIPTKPQIKQNVASEAKKTENSVDNDVKQILKTAEEKKKAETANLTSEKKPPVKKVPAKKAPAKRTLNKTPKDGE